MWEVVNLNLIIITIGSLLGSIKANFNDKHTKPKCSRVLNITLGLFCGISVGLHYEEHLTVWLAGLSSMTVSMLAVSVLDTIYSLAPVITKYLIELRIGKKM